MKQNSNVVYVDKGVCLEVEGEVVLVIIKPIKLFKEKANFEKQMIKNIIN